MPNSVETLLRVTQRNLKSYGQEVVEQRAVPDFRDGLKPVHRYILWACYGLGLKHGAPFKKSARTVGEVIGKFSPHGDQATYDAMVGLAGTKSEDGKRWVTRNSSVPLIEGYGNWGDNIDNAAAFRYTEARLSEFSTKYLLDPTYLAVTDFVPNFSEDEKVPLVLPAKLPVLLLNGSVSIAFGVSAECPSFEPKGVVELVKLAIAGTDVTPALCLKHLKFAPVYGGSCTSDKNVLLAFFKNGGGSLTFVPDMIEDARKQVVTITSACPGLTSSTSWQTLATNLLARTEVKSVSDSTDATGFKFEVTSSRRCDFDQFVQLIRDMTTRKQSYQIGITRRTLKGVSFAYVPIPKLVNEWCDWRIELEVKVLKYLIGEEKTKLARLELMLLAVLNLKIVIASLNVDDSAAYLAQHLKITLDEANQILELRVRQLKKLEIAKLKTNIKTVNTTIRALNADLKSPFARVLKSLSETLTF
jgi:topoisomerase-4 subunit A